MKTRRTLALTLAAATAVAGTTAGIAFAPASGTPATPVSVARDAPASGHFEGTLDSGATWIADVPTEWNGTTILFSHGFGPLTAADAPDPETRNALLARGYALVGSSYSGGSWWALRSALGDQHGALRALEKIIGRARHTIAWGQSMGGLISALTAEHTRGRVDGALTTCGIVGGGLDLNEYQLHGAHAIAELLAPGEEIKLVDYASTAEAQASAAQLADAVRAAAATAEGQARIALASAFFNLPEWSTPAAQAEQLTAVLGFTVAGRWHLEASAGGNTAATVGADYADLLAGSAHAGQVEESYAAAGLDLGADLSRLRAAADITRDPAAVASFMRTSVPSGRTDVPELTIHTVADQIVPVEHEATYASRVSAAGRGALLRQAWVDRDGHCAFEPAETVAALSQLEERIETGAWPATDAATLNDAAMATGLGGEPSYVAYEPSPLAAGFPTR